MFYSTWFEMLWFRSVLVQTSSHRKAFAQKITSQMSVNDSHQELSCVTVLRFWTKKKSTIGSAGRERRYAGRCWSAAFRLLSPEVISAVWEQKKNQTKQKKKQKNTHVTSFYVCLSVLTYWEKNRKIEKSTIDSGNGGGQNASASITEVKTTLLRGSIDRREERRICLCLLCMSVFFR